MELLESWEDLLKRGPNTPRQQQRAEDAEGVSFAQHGFVDDRQEEGNEDIVQASEQDGPANNSSLVSKSSRKYRKKNKNKVKFEQDAAGNPAIPHQSHVMDGEEEFNQGDSGDVLECPHCNGEHTLANCPNLTLEQLREIHLQIL